MPIVCPDCGVQNPIDPSQYAAVIKSAEAGTHAGYCISCLHRWAYTPEQQRAIASELRRLMVVVQ
jgi:hypothetical protein